MKTTGLLWWYTVQEECEVYLLGPCCREGKSIPHVCASHTNTRAHRYIYGMQWNGRPGFKIKSNYFFHHKTIYSKCSCNLSYSNQSVNTKICFIISNFPYLGELVGLPWVGEARRGGKGGAGGMEVVTRRRGRGEERGDIMGLRPLWNLTNKMLKIVSWTEITSAEYIWIFKKSINRVFEKTAR